MIAEPDIDVMGRACVEEYPADCLYEVAARCVPCQGGSEAVTGKASSLSRNTGTLAM